METLTISYVIPAKDEEGSIKHLYKELRNANRRHGIRKYEVIFIDDGSQDNTFGILKKIHSKDKNVKVIRFRSNLGKSLALKAGFELAKNQIIITMDGDLQDNPSEIYRFLAKINEGYDLVSGWKKIRHDPWHKIIPSGIFNLTTRLLTGIEIHDINCGFKAYKRQVVENLDIYGELYRFIPVFAAKQGFAVTEIVVRHRKRKHGKSKYGVGRNLKGLIDLFTVVFLTGFIRRPAHFFGSIGLVSFFTGFVVGIFITYLRVTTGTIQDRQPLLFLGILLMIVGIQLMTTGLLAELFINTNSKRMETSFHIKERLG